MGLTGVLFFFFVWRCGGVGVYLLNASRKCVCHVFVWVHGVLPPCCANDRCSSKNNERLHSPPKSRASVAVVGGVRGLRCVGDVYAEQRGGLGGVPVALRRHQRVPGTVQTPSEKEHPEHHPEHPELRTQEHRQHCGDYSDGHRGGAVYSVALGVCRSHGAGVVLPHQQQRQ